MKLSKTDMEAVKRGDSNYINVKGANAYKKHDYVTAMEYYHLACSMGNVNACTNLGYCYLYGRVTEPNLGMAIAYFELSAARNDVDACYKLGDIYGSDKWGVKDTEMSVYYYRMAASFIIEDDWSGDTISFTDRLSDYPGLCFAIGREMMPNGHLGTDIRSSYQFLKHAERGYRIEILNGADFCRNAYENVQTLLSDPFFDEVRDYYDHIFDGNDEQVVLN